MPYKSTGSSGGVPQYEEFTSSGTWTRPAGVNVVEYILVGPGGGGEGGDTSAHRMGGGGGQIQKGPLGVTGDLTITIGSGGAGGSSAVGSDGGNSILAGGAVTPITAHGGGGGDQTVANFGIGGGYRRTSSSDTLYPTAKTEASRMALGMHTQAGSMSAAWDFFPPSGGLDGQVGDIEVSTNYFVAGAGSYKGGGAQNTSGTGTAGTANGGGGGGGGNTTGGAGADGYCLITWLA